MPSYLESLTKAVQAMHGFPCHRLRTSRVHESMEGKTVWEGDVETFALVGHPKATEAFAWGWDDNGEVRYIAVLNTPPIVSPREAVQAAIASKKIKVNLMSDGLFERTLQGAEKMTDAELHKHKAGWKESSGAYAAYDYEMKRRELNTLAARYRWTEIRSWIAVVISILAIAASLYVAFLKSN